MNKKVALGAILAGLGLAATGQANNWYVGAGLGYTKADASTGVGMINLGAAPTRSQQLKDDLSTSGMFGSLFAGHKFSCPTHAWFVQLRGILDNGNKSKKTFVFDGPTVAATDVNLSMRRLGTISFDVGIVKTYKDIDFSLQFSTLISKFETKLLDVDNNFSRSGSSYVWGIAPSVGVEKAIGPVVIGLKYEYQIYAPLKYQVDKAQAPNLGYSMTSKPRYHSVMVSVKKEF